MINLILIIGIILAILWLLGLVTSYTLGGAIHVLVVISIIMFIVWVVIKLKK